MPSEYSLICSKHFVNGRPSDDTANPDYSPTIFASHGNPKSLDDLERFKRAKKRLDEKDKVISVKVHILDMTIFLYILLPFVSTIQMTLLLSFILIYLNK